MASGIVVLYNGKIGIIGTNGNSILPTEYLEIRDNIIDESNKKEIKGDWSWIWNVKNGFVYRYSKDHPLDTSNLETIIVRSDFFVSDGTIACCKMENRNSTLLLLEIGMARIFFSIENGFVLGENADRIIPLTSDDYLIQNGDKFRLVSTNLDSNSLSIEFDEAKVLWRRDIVLPSRWTLGNKIILTKTL